MAWARLPRHALPIFLVIRSVFVDVDAYAD
jgi:hypothetical protein